MKKNFIKPSVKAMHIDSETLMTASEVPGMSTTPANNSYPQGGDAKPAVGMPKLAF